MGQTYIDQLKSHIGQTVTLSGCVWIVLLAVLSMAGVGYNSAINVDAHNNSTGIPVSQPRETPDPEIDLGIPVLNEIYRHKMGNPTITSQAMADHGNKLLPVLGFSYDLDLEKIIRTKIRAGATKPIKKAGDDFPYVSLPIQIRSVAGQKKTLSVTAPAEDVCCCGYYYTPIPVTQISSARMTVVIDRKEVVMRRTKDFPVVQEYMLYEDRKPPKKVRSWEVPYETYPYGVSADGLSLYIEIDARIADLLLEISSDGSLKFVPKKTEGVVTHTEDLRKLPPPKEGEILHKSGEFGLLRYVVAGKRYLLEFPYPCT